MRLVSFPVGLELPANLEFGGRIPTAGFRATPFTVDWLNAGGDILFHFNARPDAGVVVLNSCFAGAWGGELVARAPYPFGLELGTAFRLRFEIGSDRFRVFVDDQRFCEFPHRAPPSSIAEVRATIFLWRRDCDQQVSEDRRTDAGAILTYHRVDELEHDPWGLAVEPGRFAEHLEVIRDVYRPVRLAGLVEGLREGSIADSPIVVTFDDGYRDNLELAKPLLERYEIPATVFVVSAYVDSNRDFWWDRLGQICLEATGLPTKGELALGVEQVKWNLARKNGRQNLVTSRRALYMSLWAKLKELTEGQRLEALETLASVAGVDAPSVPTTLSAADLARLGEGGLVEIGAHTRTHDSLASLPSAAQFEQMRSSKVELEALLGRSVDSISYPYGETADDTADLAERAGFACALTSTSSPVTPDSGRFALPRLAVKNWSGPEFAARLAAWIWPSSDRAR